jgi:hypothetical protein
VEKKREAKWEKLLDLEYYFKSIGVTYNLEKPLLQYLTKITR